MSETELELHAAGLLFKISVTTGWRLPEIQEAVNVLSDQFQKKLREDFSSLNIQEIEYAFRSEGTKVKDWGKSINLSIIDEVLHPYIARRAEIRKLEEGAIKPYELQAPQEKLSPEQWVNLVKDIYLKTKLMGLIPIGMYDVLVEMGEIDLTREEKETIKGQTETRLATEAANESMKAQKELVHLKRQPKQYEEKLRMESKKQAVAIYFTKLEMIDSL